MRVSSSEADKLQNAPPKTWAAVLYFGPNAGLVRERADKTARAIAPYNVVDSQFATLSAERDAQERAAREVGEDIRTRLGLYFEQHFNKSS